MRYLRILIGVFAVVVAVAAAGAYSVLAQGDCVGDIDCYEEPSSPSSPSSGGSDDSGDGESSASQPWEGTTDGRLNAREDEDYSVYCQGDSVQVWASLVEIAGPMETISLRRIVDMAAGTNFTSEGGMTVNKGGDGDTITITGSPSNNGGAGSKSFSQAACVSSNGGMPPAAEEEAPQVVQASVEEPVQNNTTTAEETTEETTEEEPVRVETQDEFLLRVFGTAGSSGASSLEIFWAWVIVLCQPWGLSAMVLPYGYNVWRKRRKK